MIEEYLGKELSRQKIVYKGPEVGFVPVIVTKVLQHSEWGRQDQQGIRGFDNSMIYSLYS